LLSRSRLSCTLLAVSISLRDFDCAVFSIPVTVSMCRRYAPPPLSCSPSIRPNFPPSSFCPKLCQSFSGLLLIFSPFLCNSSGIALFRFNTSSPTLRFPVLVFRKSLEKCCLLSYLVLQRPLAISRDIQTRPVLPTISPAPGTQAFRRAAVFPPSLASEGVFFPPRVPSRPRRSEGLRSAAGSLYRFFSPVTSTAPLFDGQRCPLIFAFLLAQAPLTAS